MYCFNNYLLTVLLFSIIVMISYMFIMMDYKVWMTYKNYSAVTSGVGVSVGAVEIKEWSPPDKTTVGENNDFFGYNLEYYSDKKRYDQMDSFFELSPASNVKSVPKPRNTIT